VIYKRKHQIVFIKNISFFFEAAKK